MPKQLRPAGDAKTINLANNLRGPVVVVVLLVAVIEHMSIYKDQLDNNARDEIKYLLEKRANYGWTQKDADRYNYLKDLIGD